MTNGENRVAQEHPRARITHHCFHLCFLVRFIAVDRTLITRWFILPIRAAIELLLGIIQQGLALLTRWCALVVVLTIQHHHMANRLVFNSEIAKKQRLI